MQLTIAMCDDDKVWLHRAKATIQNIEEEKGITLAVSEYQNSRELLKESALKRPDIIFLNLAAEAGDTLAESDRKSEAVDEEEAEEAIVESGIELVRILNDRWPLAQIVYLTNYTSYTARIYDTRHAYYVLKEQFEDRIYGIIRRVIDQIVYQEMRVHFSLLHEGEAVLKVSEITYFERNLRKTIIHLSGEKKESELNGDNAKGYVIKDRIDDIYKKLPKGEFLRCHNSYIANLSHIRVFHRDEIVLDNGRCLPISRAYQKPAREKFTAWIEARNL